jgi:quinol monooxygenase YgiN
MRTVTKPVTMLCTYRPKKGKAKELLSLVRKHWRTLNSVGLATKQPASIYRATDKKSGRVYFVEIFSWRDAQASAVAHQTPEVMAIWEPMGPILDSLDLAIIEPVGGKV